MCVLQQIMVMTNIILTVEPTKQISQRIRTGKSHNKNFKPSSLNNQPSYIKYSGILVEKLRETNIARPDISSLYTNISVDIIPHIYLILISLLSNVFTLHIKVIRV